MNQTSLELKGDREIVIARTFNGPARIVFDAWTRPELVSRRETMDQLEELVATLR
jgi:hypothetical protein